MIGNIFHRPNLLNTAVFPAGVGLIAALLLASCGKCTRVDDKDISAQTVTAAEAFPANAPHRSTPAVDAAKAPDAARAEDIDAPPKATQTPQQCAAFTEKTQTGKLASAQIDEASGLAASWAHEGLLWTHNDSGDSARVFLMRPDGAVVAEVHLTSVEEAIDFEDIAVAPCAAGSPQSCVYVADTGDNLSARDKVVIYRFPEPELPKDHRQDLGRDQRSTTIDVEDVHAIWFDYADGPRDVETLMVHPQSRAIYVVEKNPTSKAPVFRVPGAATTPSAPARAVEIATLELQGRSSLFAMITAGDIAPNGREFTLRTYLESYTYCAPEAGSKKNSEDNFEDVFKVSPTRAALPVLPQGEALTYDRAGDAIWLTSEGVHSPILRVKRPD